ncbi:MAG: YybH family protein [Hyphomicrobiales bacterium]
MKRVIGAVGCLLVLGALADAARPASAGDAPPKISAGASGFAVALPDSAAVQRDVDAGNAQFIRGWMTGDADAFAGCFASDGALFRSGGSVLEGRDAIRERMKGVFARYRMASGSIRTTGLWFHDDRAYETGKWVFAIGERDSLSAAAPDSGYYLEIWKLEDGTWRMWRDIGIPQE